MTDELAGSDFVHPKGGGDFQIKAKLTPRHGIQIYRQMEIAEVADPCFRTNWDE